MATGVRIEGSWPGRVQLSRGWARASARPWNHATEDALLRLDRGGLDFLEAATDTVAELGGAYVFSPAVYPASTRIWRRAGYEEVEQLEIFECATSRAEFPNSVREALQIDWQRIQAIDDEAFEGFWRMSTDGLKEALASTKQAAMLVTGEDSIDGYAIVGAQWNASYLQRIAVHPDSATKGLGRALLTAALAWGRRKAAPTMVLNVRDENERAREVYTKAGFGTTGVRLRILRYGS